MLADTRLVSITRLPSLNLATRYSKLAQHTTAQDTNVRDNRNHIEALLNTVLRVCTIGTC